MTLINDEFMDIWVWVEDKNHDIELSPQFDTEEQARLWKARITNILKHKE